jgi:hypothetical protein
VLSLRAHPFARFGRLEVADDLLRELSPSAAVSISEGRDGVDFVFLIEGTVVLVEFALGDGEFAQVLEAVRSRLQVTLGIDLSSWEETVGDAPETRVGPAGAALSLTALAA